MAISHRNHPARLAALAAGEDVFEGSCKHHGLTLRYTATGTCQKCELAKRAKAREREAVDNPYLTELRQKREARKPALAAEISGKKPEVDENALLIKANSEYLRRLMLEKLEGVRNAAV
jgi:hypothetical protein